MMMVVVVVVVELGRIGEKESTFPRRYECIATDLVWFSLSNFILIRSAFHHRRRNPGIFFYSSGPLSMTIQPARHSWHILLPY